MRSTPWIQAAILKLPRGKHSAARVLGFLSGGQMRAVVNQANYKLDLREAIQRQMFLRTYEPTESDWFKQCVGPGDIFIDVGANFGHYTSLGAALVGETGKVFAFEPSPIANRVLETMIIESNIQNVLLTKAALGRTNSTVELFMPTSKHLHSPSLMRSDPGFAPFNVPVMTLDTFEPLTRVDKVKLVKMDVEGYEPDVLDGMANLIKQKKVLNIFCEFNSWWLARNAITPKQLLERFLDYGFVIYKQTKLQIGLAGSNGVSFDLQDIWFTFAGG